MSSAPIACRARVAGAREVVVPVDQGTALCSALARAINASGSAEPAPIDTAASIITAATHTTELTRVIAHQMDSRLQTTDYGLRRLRPDYSVAWLKAAALSR